MDYQIEFTNTQTITGVRSANGAIRKAKRFLKSQIGSKAYRELITDVRVICVKNK